MINIPKKKGRKSKKDLEQLALLNQQKDLLKDDNLSQQEKENKINELKESADLLDKVVVEEKVPKKRGRKPRGGKIVPINSNLIDTADLKQNVILHLKCNLKDLNKLYENKLESFNFNNQKNELKYDSIFYDKIKSDEYNGETFFGKIIENEIIDNKENNNDDSNQSNNLTDKNIDNKNLNKKIENLIKNFHFNNISDKKTACFWCTYDFANPPIYIPQNRKGNNYEVYGCFCSPECGCAYLMNENIDNSVKFERYYLLNNIYCKIYDYEKNIKPAPSPYYLLDKYMGSLSIQEYRKLLQNERLLLVIDKPLTPILPELFYENDDFTLTNKSIPVSL